MRVHRTFDTLLEMKDAGLVASSAAAQVGGSNLILDLGAGWVQGELVIDVTAIETDTGDEIFTIGWQLSSSATFASSIFEAVSLKMGDATQIPGDTDTPVGRYNIPVTNLYGGTVYRYARLYTTVAGTIATGINYAAYLGLMRS